MNIFESLENLPISEECFNDILSIVEDKELTPNKERHLEKLSHKIAKAKVKEQEQGKTKKVRDKIDAAYNKHANKYHEYVTGSKDYEGLSPKELAQANGYALESLENLPISEECFNEIMDMIEEYINETKKARKVAHHDIIFKKLNPEGVDTFADDYKGNKEEAVKLLKNAHKSKFSNAIVGKAQSMSDLRKVRGTDSKDSAPSYDYEVGDDVRSCAAEDVRDALGRDGEFSAEPPKPSKSAQAAKAYAEYKNILHNLKNNR